MVVTVITGVAVVGLRGSRDSARDALTSVNLRNHAAAMTSYVTDHRGRFPRFLDIGSLNQTVACNDLSFAGLSYFDQFQTWHIALANNYTSPLASKAFDSPHLLPSERSTPLFTSYEYSCAFVASPEFWDPAARVGPAQWVGVADSHVRFPSHKVLLRDGWIERAHRTVRPHVLSFAATTDASVRDVRPEQWLPGHDRGEGYLFQSFGAVHYSDAGRGLHTQMGVHGRDVR